MIPFGSITSVVPLVVLGFAYLVYLGAILLNKPAACELAGTGKTISIIEGDSNADQVRETPDFRFIVDNEIDAADKYETDIIDWEHFLSVLHELPVAVPSVLHSVSQFLPRPPPAC